MNHYNSLKDALTGIFNEEVTILSRQSLSGGDISSAYRLKLNNNRSLFLKQNRSENINLFQAEYFGLEEMNRIGGIGIPTPLAVGLEEKHSFLLLNLIEPEGKIFHYWEDFGHSLAQFHKQGRGEKFGFVQDNFIGSTCQKNNYHSSWVDFFREERLEYQIKLAYSYFDSSIRKKAITLLTHLDIYLTEPEYPSLLHGDLWSGNVITGSDGKAWIIDPAVYYGHAEADLAMTELFGSFSQIFYKSYNEINPPISGYAKRRDLYNLYHLLNHLNMFGASYLGSVEKIINHY